MLCAVYCENFHTDCPIICENGTCYQLTGMSACKSGYYSADCSMSK